MKSFLKTLPVLTVLVSSSLNAADAPKAKVIDAFNTIDPKTVKLYELKAKIVSTPDPAHHKALEMVVDYAKAGTYPRVIKSFVPGLIDPRKYSGIRVFYKSETETGVSIVLRTGVTNPDGRNPSYAAYLKGSAVWQEAVLPFANFKTYEQKVFKDGAQKIFPKGEAILPEEYGQFKEILFVFDINSRGNATTGVFLLDGLELIPN